MALINENAKTGDDMLKDGVMGQVRHMQYMQGKSTQEIRRELHRRYPNVGQRGLEAVMRLAEQSKKSAGIYNRASNGYTMDRSRMGTNAHIPSAYRWVVNVRMVDPNSGIEGHHMSIVNSTKNLTKEQIQFEAGRLASITYGNSARRGKSDLPDIDPKSAISYEFVSAECRTC